MNAVNLCVLGAGAFLMTGLLTGVWKYVCMHTRTSAEAPRYVDIAHRAALLYAFAALVMAELAAGSQWSSRVNFWAAAIPLVFFALAIGTYVLHGILDDTDNQLRQPHVLGTRQLPAWQIALFMVLLAIGEIGGVGVLLVGYAAGM